MHPNDNETSTPPEDVAPACVLVELHDLKTKAGNPVRVYVERVPEERLLAIMQQLPGDMPKPTPVPGETPPPTDESARAAKQERVFKWLAWANDLIEAGSFMVRTDGTEVRPAFLWPGPDKPLGLSVRGTYLSSRDRTLLAGTILKLSGWTKEAAAPASFHGEDGGGSGGGAGAVDAGGGVG